jgi:diguanylate cyclase (GGDEF)-like protein
MKPLRAKSPGLRTSIVGVALLTIALVDVVAVAYSSTAARNSSIAVARDAIGREGNATAESILRHLEPAQQSTNVTGLLLESDLLDTTNPAFERYLYTQLAVMPQMTGIFVGFEDGGFVFVNRENPGYRSKRIATSGERRSVEIVYYDQTFHAIDTERPTNDDFDPRARPWYSLASPSDHVEWTDPYVFFSSGKPGVTAARAVHRDGRTVAVVGVDVELSGLATFLDHLSVAQAGEAFVVSGRSIVAAPTAFAKKTVVNPDGALRLLTTDEVGVPALTATGEDAVRRVATSSGHDLVLHRRLPTDQGLRWTVVLRAPESEFTAPVHEQQRLSLLFSLGGLGLLAGALAMVRATRPLVRLQKWAATDALTGIANRRTIYERGDELVLHSRKARATGCLAVLLIDLDGFKTINDTNGHEAGDQALQAVGKKLEEFAVDDTLVGRLGGDEFVIVYPVETVHAATTRAREIVAAVGEHLSSSFRFDTAVTASGGLTVTDAIDRDFSALVVEADAALIRAKAQNPGSLEVAERIVHDRV